MDLGRPSLGDWIAGSGGALLLVSLFLPWYDRCSGACDVPAAHARGDAISAWQAFSALDVALLLTALMGISLPLLAGLSRVAAVPIATAALTALVSMVAGVWVLVRVLELPGPDSAIERAAFSYVGLAATVGVVLGAWLSMRDEGFGLRPAPEIAATLGGEDHLADVPVLPVPPAAGTGARNG